MDELREERQAAALRRVAEAAACREQARVAERAATSRLRDEVASALDTGATTRRVAEIARISLDTVNRWAPKRNPGAQRTP